MEWSEEYYKEVKSINQQYIRNVDAILNINTYVDVVEYNKRKDAGEFEYRDLIGRKFKALK